MCLAVPAQVDELEAASGWVRVGDARMRVSLLLTPEAEIGDWVLVHAGFAIQRIDEEDARATWQLLEDAASTTEARP